MSHPNDVSCYHLRHNTSRQFSVLLVAAKHCCGGRDGRMGSIDFKRAASTARSTAAQFSSTDRVWQHCRDGRTGSIYFLDVRCTYRQPSKRHSFRWQSVGSSHFSLKYTLACVSALAAARSARRTVEHSFSARRYCSV